MQARINWIKIKWGIVCHKSGAGLFLFISDLPVLLYHLFAASTFELFKIMNSFVAPEHWLSRSRTGWCQYLSLLPRREEEGTVLRTVKGLGRRSLPGGGWKGRRGGGNIQPTLWTPVVVVAPMAPRASRDLGVMIPPPPSHPVTSLSSHIRKVRWILSHKSCEFLNFETWAMSDVTGVRIITGSFWF